LGSGGLVLILPTPSELPFNRVELPKKRVAMDTRWIPPGTATQILDKIDALGFPDTAAKSCLAIRPIIHHLVRGNEEE
jgi:hypothetical protein